MEPAVLIFLLYVMIAHELFCGVMQYRRQANKPRKRHVGPMLYSSNRVQGAWSVSSQLTRTEPCRTERGRDPRKSCRIVRKAVSR